MKLPPILLTSSVYAMDFTVVLRDPEERKLHTLNSINHWLNIHPDIQLVIDETKKLLGNTYIACHIRRTDRKKEAIDDKEYIKFINSYPLDLKIYIATDCRDTQQTFIDLYPDRLIYKKIEDNNNLRQTSLQDAVKDIYVCAGATYFMRSAGTFSNTIEHIRKLKN